VTAAARRLPLIQQYLREQNELSAVQRFSHAHDAIALGTPRYRELMPATAPGPGQQYAFSVDLDRCTGCKACVTACHNLNGLDSGETWRSVGLLHGGTAEKPVQQTVTTACHHCLDPACLNGCPVKAYDKDPITGIVKHLDDQCIGCKYCTLTCPYEVPQYNADKGIVRKCDMCSERLAVGEAPACVQACPNEAISIELVNTRDALENAQGDAFLPGAPSPGMTVPTTSYKTTRVLPRNMLPADFYAVRPSEEHRPLVAMLVLTQLSVGAFCVDWIMTALGASSAVGTTRFVQALVSLAVGLLALGASLAHLGRPLYAFRAVLGLRTSWLSREILGFGLFAKLAVVHALVLWPRVAALLGPLAGRVAFTLGAAVAVAGLGAVLCSVMVYAATLRTYWSFSRTGFRFVMTTAVLGTAAVLAYSLAVARVTGGYAPRALFGLCVALASAMLLKLAGEASALLHLRDKQQSDLKRSALLLVGELLPLTRARFALGLAGGVACPTLIALTSESGVSTGVLVTGALALVLAVSGELLERLTFFSAMSAPKMPGGLR
jgi:Fe-S-cluster-containing dehydrogenase component/DMSO reductase anchor subunit